MKGFFKSEKLDELAIPSSQDIEPLISNPTVIHTINLAKNNKLMRLDNILIKLIKILDDNHIKHIVKLYNEIYICGQFPSEWAKLSFQSLKHNI